MIKYVKIFCDISETVDVLSDAEAGRLLKSLLHYGLDGTVDQLPGQEKLVFHMLKAQIDRDWDSYNQTLQRNRENGAKGGRPKKPTKTQQNPVGFEKTQQNPVEPTKRQDKDKDKEYIPPISPMGMDDDDVLLEIAQRNQRVYDHAKACGFNASTSDLDRLTAFIADYGPDAVVSALDACVDSQAINYRYLRAVLAGEKKEQAKPKKDYKSEYLFAQ